MRIAKNKYWVFYLLFQIFSQFINAQDLELNFFHLVRENGLSDNTVNAIVSDDEGFVWIGTNVGLNRYDGTNFHIFYNSEDSTSLPNNKVEHLFITKSGELWVATNTNGVSLFNPISQNFTNFNFETDNHETGANIVHDIIEDSDSVLFVSTGDGLFYKYPYEKNFKEIPIINQTDSANKGVLLNNNVSIVTEDEEQGIWIVYENWEITYYHHKKNVVKHYDVISDEKNLNSAYITSAIHFNSKLWIGTTRFYLFCLDPIKNEATQPIQNEKIVSFYQLLLGESGNTLWLATSDGLMRYNLASGNLTRYTNRLLDERSLNSTPISCIYEAENNIIWVGTYSEGINYAYLNMPFKHLYISLETEYALSESSVTSILHDSYGDTWFAYQSSTIELFSSTTYKKIKIPLNSIINPWSSGTVFKLFQSSDNVIYACSWSGGIQRLDREKLRFYPLTGSKESFLSTFEGATDFRDIEEDLNGNFWLALHGKGIYYYDAQNKITKKYNHNNGLANDWVFDIDIDTSGNVWVGTAWGLSRIDPKTDSVKTYLKVENDTTSLTNNLVQSVKVTDDGKIWAGTPDGLNLYNEELDIFFHVKIDNGQKETDIRGIEQDYVGVYWISTTNGIVKFRLKESENQIPYLYEFYSFTTSDGLQSNNFNLASSSRDGNGIIFFGSSKGIDYFNPKAIKTSNTEPKLQILKYRINGEIVYPGSKNGPFIDENGYILLSHKQNMLDIEYVAIHFSNVERDNYKYRLDPLNDNWINADNNKNINFSNLNPGKYELSLRVITDKGLTGTKENIVKFYIRPPFWQKTWFLVISFLFFVLLIILVIRIYTAFLRRKKNQLEKIVQERTSEINKKNEILKEQSNFLNETNTLLEERQQHIEEQSEELKAQSEKLAITNEELNKLVALKDKLFSIIAHDLKNPFNTILGFSELLKNSYKDFSEEKIKLMMEYINSSARSAYSLLENLLSWSRSQTNKLDVNPKYMMVSKIVESNYKLIQAAMSQKKLTFEANYDNALKVWADEALLNTILRNVISNATKFTREGGKITVNVNVINENKICFEVKDTGIGLTKKEIEAMFNIDTNISKPGTSGEKGTGIGMILCKEFVEKLKGKIWIESESDKGTSVFFTVPSEPLK